jgi:hypothetical protein
MKQISFIDEGNADEFIPREPRTEQERQHYARAKELQAKFRGAATSHFVRLNDDLAAAFPSPAAVNEALRRVLREGVERLYGQTVPLPQAA